MVVANTGLVLAGIGRREADDDSIAEVLRAATDELNACRLAAAPVGTVLAKTGLMRFVFGLNVDEELELEPDAADGGRGALDSLDGRDNGATGRAINFAPAGLILLTEMELGTGSAECFFTATMDGVGAPRLADDGRLEGGGAVAEAGFRGDERSAGALPIG